MTESSKENPNSDSQKSKRKPNQLMRFSGMAVQMGVTIGLGAWGGSVLDAKYQTEKPLWTIGLSLLGVFISLYLLIQQLSDDS